MPPPGGNKEHVKIVPFGTKPPAPSDYAHLKDIGTMSFARNLAVSMPDTRKPVAAKKKKTSDDDDTNGGDRDDKPEEPAAIKPISGGKSKIDPEDLARFLESEGGGDPADMCSLSRCMDVVSQIISNDKSSKVEKAMIQGEMEAMLVQVKEAEVEADRLAAIAEGHNKEIVMLETQAERQQDYERDISTKKEDLEREKRGFSTKQALLEKDQRQWVSKLRTAQAAHAKAIWRKPGQAYDEDEVSIFDGSVQSIRQTTKRDQEDCAGPSQLPYDKQAHLVGVSDYIERPVSLPTYSRYVQVQIALDERNTVSQLKGRSGVNTHNDSGSGSGSGSVVSTAASASVATANNSVMSYRKSALCMSKEVRSFLKTSAAKSLRNSHGTTAEISGPGGLSACAAMDGKVRSGQESPNLRLKPLSARATSPSHSGGGGGRGGGGFGGAGGGWASDDQTVATMTTMSTLGVGSVSGGGDGSYFNDVNNRGGLNLGVGSRSSNGSVSGSVGGTGSIRLVQPKIYMPPHTGKMRVNTSGVGKINKKSKTIKELLAEEEELL